jgi:putative phage-type endonuclease
MMHYLHSIDTEHPIGKTDYKLVHLEQGSQEWLNFRRSHITATDACVIMGSSPWKTAFKLYEEKTNAQFKQETNERMQRGIDLEPVARHLCCIKTGFDFSPVVAVKDWTMASLDGMTSDGNQILEIKCPGPKDHAMAAAGKIPDHYYPQLQHQMYVCGLEKCHYFSFDGIDGELVVVYRCDDYIRDMLEKERVFYDCLMSKTPPEGGDLCVYRSDEEWSEYAGRWKYLNDQIRILQKEEETIREHLIKLAGQSNTKGEGICVSQVTRKGNVDYTRIPELKGIDLEAYRKPDSTFWKFCCA